MAKVFLTRPILEPAIQLLEDAGHTVVVGKNQMGLSKKALIKELKNGNYDALLSSLTDTIDKEVIDSFNGKIIANYAVGFNNIDVPYAKSKGLFVTNTPTSSEAVAEFAAALTIALERKLFSADSFVRRGLFNGFNSNLFLGHNMRGKVLGVIGTGRIGGAFARIMSQGFRMSIVYTDNVRNERIEKECNARQVSIEELLEFSDIISLHVPLTPQTKHLIGAKEH
jgi:glyoxylate reductase